MSKILMYILILLIPTILFAQDSEKDLQQIILKAKMFTISQYNIENEKTVIDFIDGLKYEVYKVEEFIFIKVYGKYYCWDNTKTVTASWCDCDYYIGYSETKNFYYLLGGFQKDNIREFAREFETSITKLSYKIDDKNLNSFIQNIVTGKINKAKKDFEICVEKF